MKVKNDFFRRLYLPEIFQIAGSIALSLLFVCHIMGLKVPITIFPYCFGMYVVQHNECPVIVKILGYLYGLCPFLLILVLSEKYNKTFMRYILYVWLFVDFLFVVFGFNPTAYQDYKSLFHGWHPIPAVLFDLFLLLRILLCSPRVRIRLGLAEKTD